MFDAMAREQALRSVSPAALSAYARAQGWVRTEAFGRNSDVYDAEGLPEIVIPRTQMLGDYHTVVGRLLEIFSEIAEVGQDTLYRDLVFADRDVVRLRVLDGSDDGMISALSGSALVKSGYDLLAAAACSVDNPRALYSGRNTRANSDFLGRVRLGHTEPGSFVVTLFTTAIPPVLSPVQPALLQDDEKDDSPFDRRATLRFGEALMATRRALDETSVGNGSAFMESVDSGSSANFCEALVAAAKPFRSLDVSVTWARTRPVDVVRRSVRLHNGDVPLLEEAARHFRSQEPLYDVSLFGYVYSLRRAESQAEGTVSVRALVEGRVRSVEAVLGERDYERAIGAHGAKDPVILEGDLERRRGAWHLMNPCLVEVVSGESESDEEP